VRRPPQGCRRLDSLPTSTLKGYGHRDGAKRKARALTSTLGCDLGLHNFHGLPRPIIMVADEGPEPHSESQVGAPTLMIEADVPSTGRVVTVLSEVCSPHRG
jgi:hypothetical protein